MRIVKTGTRSQRILISNPHFATSILGHNLWSSHSTGISWWMWGDMALIPPSRKAFLPQLLGLLSQIAFCHQPFRDCLPCRAASTKVTSFPLGACIQDWWRLGHNGLTIAITVGQLQCAILAPEVPVVLVETIRPLSSPMASPFLPLSIPALAPSLP